MQLNDTRTILVVDDEPGLRELLRINLEHEGFRVIQAENGAVALDAVRKHHPDLMVLDVMMPEMDGWEACRRLRAFSRLPVLMLTARVSKRDTVMGLESGADDYLVKPFDVDEFVARVRALLRRVPPANVPVSAGSGEVLIDRLTREVRVRGDLIDLTPTEYDLLLMLAEHAGIVMRHDTLLQGVWGQQYARDNDYLKVYIWHLRRKVERNPREPNLLLTEWGVGYRLVP